jgi:gluconolactonase
MRLLFLLAILPVAAQDFSEVKTEKAFAGYRFTEGPAWSPEGYMVFFDVPANRMLKWVPGAKPQLSREDSGGAMGAAFDAQGRLYICESRGRRVIRIDKHGKLEVVAERFEGKRFNAPNDIVVRKDGNAWFTDPAFGSQQNSKELDFYGVYHVTPKGDLEVLARLKTRPNGIALGPAGRSLYVANSDERNIRVWDVDKAGACTNQRVAVSGIDGVPDGIRTDEKGNLYVAARQVFIYSPSGKLLHSIELGEKPSNLTFGDPDLMTLYITARTSVYRVRLDVKGVTAYQ